MSELTDTPPPAASTHTPSTSTSTKKRCPICKRLSAVYYVDGAAFFNTHGEYAGVMCPGAGKEAVDPLDDELRRERTRREARRIVEQEERATQQPKTVLVFDGEEELTAVEYVVAGVVPDEGAGMLFGESDVGKTFVATSIGVHVAADKPWMGHPVKRGTVIMFEAEGGRAYALRKHAAKGAAGLGDSRQLAQLPFVTIYGPLAFGVDTDPATAVANAAYIRAAVQERGLPPVRLVVVDTLSQNMAGDADNNAEMQAFLRLFRAFLKALSDEPVFGLLLHHPGHAEKHRGRGAYALTADVDLIMHLEGTPEALTLSCKRMRDDAPFAPIPLKLERRVITVDGEVLRNSRGGEQTTLVVLPRDAIAGEHPSPARDEVAAAVLEALPDYPEKEGIEATVCPKVSATLGRPVDVKTVRTRCYVLQRQGLAECGPGRQKGSVRWGKAKPQGDL